MVVVCEKGENARACGGLGNRCNLSAGSPVPLNPQGIHPFNNSSLVWKVSMLRIFYENKNRSFHGVFITVLVMGTTLGGRGER